MRRDADKSVRREAGDPVAALDRRGFLKRAGVGAAALAAGCGWQGGPLEGLLQWWWGPTEAIQRALVPPRPRARILPPGAETPGVPAYFISDRVPTTDVATWRLEIGGMVARPLSLSLDDLFRLPRTTLRLRHYCIEGWTAVSEWSGVQLAYLAELAGADRRAEYVDFRSFDSGYWSSWDRDAALHPQTLIAYARNGYRLPPAYGAPARLYSNLKYGYKSVKYLTRIAFVPQRTSGYWESRGYDWYAAL